MKLSHAIVISVLSGTAFAGAAVAQDSAIDFELPKACVQAAGHMGAMMGEMGDMDTMMKSMEGHMSEAGKGYMQAIVDMHPPMVEGAMAGDADLAFNCSMIAHHKGAIAMARVQLQYGKDQQVKALAQKIIDEQLKEVDQMTKWIEATAK